MDTFVDQIVNGVVEKLTPIFTGQPKPINENCLISIHEASEALNGKIAVSTLYIWHSQGKIPGNVVFKKGRRLFFDKDMLIQWVKAGNESKV